VAEPETPGATMYYKVLVDNEYLANHNGEVSLNLPLIVGEDSANKSLDFDVKLGAQELVTPENYGDPIPNDELDFANNLAITDAGTIAVSVVTFESEVTVSTGWAYESGAVAGSADNPDANPAAFGEGPGYSTSPTGDGGIASAAFIKIVFPADPAPGETFSEYVSFSFDSSRGEIYDRAGNQLSTADPANPGRSIVTMSRGGNNEVTLFFVPHETSDDDSDLTLDYTFYVSKNGIENKPIRGSLPIVIDAAADVPEVALFTSDGVPATDGFVLEHEVVFSPDGNETRYIIIPNPDGLLALGNLGPLAPYLTLVTDISELQAYDTPDPDAKHYFDDLGNGEFIFRVGDLAALDALDGAADGKINFAFPFTVTDKDKAGTDITVEIKTAVVEGQGNDASRWPSGDGDDIEYDFGNNIAVTTSDVVVYLVDGGFSATVEKPVYEGDKGEQHLVGDADSPEYGTALNIEFNDSHEAIYEIQFTLSTSDGDRKSVV
jgi:hypothetical protein